jgi:sulfite reductase beta subunit-like hemoprotein
VTNGRVDTKDWIPNPSNAHVLKIYDPEIANFEDKVKLFQSGGRGEVEFLRFRLRHGLYGQRQPDAQMICVKLPFGGVTADQMDVLGEMAEMYAPLKKRISLFVRTCSITTCHLQILLTYFGI